MRQWFTKAVLLLIRAYQLGISSMLGDCPVNENKA